MYRLAMHVQTDGQTDRQTDDIIAPIADHTACRLTKNITVIEPL